MQTFSDKLLVCKILKMKNCVPFQVQYSSSKSMSTIPVICLILVDDLMHSVVFSLLHGDTCTSTGTLSGEDCKHKTITPRLKKTCLLAF